MSTKRPRIDVCKAIQIHVVSEGEATKGWCHTHGLAAHGLPELEVRGVPLFLYPSAVALLNDVAAYMLNGHKPVVLGETMGLDHVIIRFVRSVPIAGDAEHFAHERWEIVDAMDATCEAIDHADR